MLKVVAALVLVAACSKSEPARGTQTAPAGHTAAPAGAKKKDPAAAKQMIASGAVVLDVRTPDEFAEDHLASATNVPIDDLAGRLADVDKLVAGDKTKPVVVYCASGGRAARAQEALEQAGYSHVVNGGGLDDLR